METATIEFKGITLVVNGNYTEGEGGYMYDNNLNGLPASASEFETYEVFVHDSDVNISELFSFEDLNEISELVILKIEE